jgi:tRNA(fMet)-specific endonuclease VapC
VIILDTQHVSQLQLVDADSAALLRARLKQSIDKDIYIAVISPDEPLREYLARINATSTRPFEQVREFESLGRLLDFYASWTGRILPFDQAAAAVLSGFSPKLIRQIGARDSRIAAIALANNATLLSANLRDFQQVPGLRVEDWLRA